MTTTTEPTVSFRDLLTTDPDVTDDTEILITAGELRERLDELGRLRAQADEDAALVGWYLYADTPHSMRTAVLSNHFGARAQVVLDARMAALPDGEPRDRAAQLAMLRSTDGDAGVPVEVWYYGDNDEGSSSEVYLDVEDAKAAAIADLEAIDCGGVTGEEQYTWRTVEKLPGCHLLDEDGRFTGWSVNRLRVVAPAAKAGA
jgi:hypothetical protein